MMFTYQRMARLRRLSFVPRWTIIPTIRKQSVAEHCFHVAWIAGWLAERNQEVQMNGSMEGVLEAALIHDEMEAIYGDVPSPAKSRAVSEALDALVAPVDRGPWYYDQIALIVKLADLIEALAFLREEEVLGNKSVGRVADGIISGIERAWVDFMWAGISPKPPWNDLVKGLFLAIAPDSHPGMDQVK